MANYATNIFYASTENEKDLDKVEKFLDETFCDCYLDRAEDSIEGEFSQSGIIPKRDKRNDFSFGEQRQDLYPSADTRAVQRVCELSGILKRRMVLQITLKHKRTMYYEEEQATEIIGCSCTLLTPYKGYTEGEVVGDYGSEIVVRLNNGKEVVEYRDEVLIYD